MAAAEQPAQLKLLKGRGNGTDTGGRPVKTPPAFRRIAPTPPSWLGREAKAEWNRVVPGLTRLGILKEEDRAHLVAYCETWQVFVDATRAVRKEGLTIEAKQGQIPHPRWGSPATPAASFAPSVPCSACPRPRRWRWGR